MRDAKSMSFFGNECVELLLGNNSIAIHISPLNHLLEHVIVSQLAKILGNFSEVLQSNEP